MGQFQVVPGPLVNRPYLKDRRSLPMHSAAWPRYPKSSEELRAPGRSEARAAGALLRRRRRPGRALAASCRIPSGGNTPALIGTAGGDGGSPACSAGSSPAASRSRVTHLALAATAAATGLLICESGVAVGQYGSIFVWATLVAAYFFPRRVAIAHLAWLLAVYAVALVAGRKHRRLLAADPLALHRRLADGGDDADQRHRRPPRQRRPARPPLLRPLPRHALHRRHGGLLRRAQLGLGGLPRLQPRGAAGGALRRARPPRGPRAAPKPSRRASSRASPRSASRTATWPRTAAGTGCAGARPWPRTSRWSTPAPPTSPS